MSLTTPIKNPYGVFPKTSTHGILLRSHKSLNKKIWIFKGDPTNLNDICNPIYQTAFKFTEELKSKMIKNLQWLGEQKGKSILIEDNHAVGVQLKNGEVLRAKTVVSNLDKQATFNYLLADTQLAEA